MSKELILITGGARSGKSALAESLAAKSDRVLFVATAQALDEDMERRIAAHRRSRPDAWETLEEPLDVAASMRTQFSGHEVVLLDCLTLWVSNMLLKDEGSQGAQDAERAILAATADLLSLYECGDAQWIVVTNEVGLGIVPPSSLGRAYRDALGRVNQLVAARADKVYLMSAGLALEIKSLGARSLDQFD